MEEEWRMRGEVEAQRRLFYGPTFPFACGGMWSEAKWICYVQAHKNGSWKLIKAPPLALSQEISALFFDTIEDFGNIEKFRKDYLNTPESSNTKTQWLRLQSVDAHIYIRHSHRFASLQPLVCLHNSPKTSPRDWRICDGARFSFPSSCKPLDQEREVSQTSAFICLKFVFIVSKMISSVVGQASIGYRLMDWCLNQCFGRVIWVIKGTQRNLVAFRPSRTIDCEYDDISK